MAGYDGGNSSIGYAAYKLSLESGKNIPTSIITKKKTTRFKRKYAQGLRIIRAKTADQEDYRYVLRDYKTGETIKEKVMNIPKARELNKLLRGSGISWARC